jgi:hypothetical protein
MMDLDPEFAAQWGIEPEDAYTMLVSPARPSAPLSLSNLARGLGQGQVGPTDRRPPAFCTLPAPAAGGQLSIKGAIFRKLGRP